MAKVEAVKAHLSNPNTLARFVANPKAVAVEMDVDLDDPAQAHELERLALTWQMSLAGVARASGLEVGTTEWGIGAGCCNAPSLRLGDK